MAKALGVTMQRRVNTVSSTKLIVKEWGDTIDDHESTLDSEDLTISSLLVDTIRI